MIFRIHKKMQKYQGLVFIDFVTFDDKIFTQEISYYLNLITKFEMIPKTNNL